MSRFLQPIYCICTVHTVRKEMILHGLVHDTARISSCFSDFRELSRTDSCSISKSPLRLISGTSTLHALQVVTGSVFIAEMQIIFGMVNRSKELIFFQKIPGKFSVTVYNRNFFYLRLMT